MLAKTKISDSSVSTTGLGNSQPHKNPYHFDGKKKVTPKPASVKKPPIQSSTQIEKKQVLVNSQKSIYKPNFQKTDSIASLPKRGSSR